VSVRPGDRPEGQSHVYAKREDVYDALIFDFDIDSPQLKDEHRRILDDIAAAVIRHWTKWRTSNQPQDPVYVFEFAGYASHTGSREHNRVLSTDRALAARDHLSTVLLQTLPPQAMIFGTFDGGPFGRSFDETTVTGENAYGRSVRVAVHPPGLTLPRIEVRSRTTTFWIRCGSFGQGNLPLPPPLNAIQGIWGSFHVAEEGNPVQDMSALYHFVGGGVQLPLLGGLPDLSAPQEEPGPWVRFTTRNPTSAGRFDGTAQIQQLPGAAGAKKINLILDHDHFDRYGERTIPQSLELEVPDSGPSVPGGVVGRFWLGILQPSSELAVP
jgi:hypothetical protein